MALSPRENAKKRIFTILRWLLLNLNFIIKFSDLLLNTTDGVYLFFRKKDSTQKFSILLVFANQSLFLVTSRDLIFEALSTSHFSPSREKTRSWYSRQIEARSARNNPINQNSIGLEDIFSENLFYIFI